MDRAGLPKDLLPEVRAQASQGVEVYPAPEKTGQLLLKPHEAQAWGAPGEELHQEVQVAFLVGLAPGEGTEEERAPDPYRPQTCSRAWERIAACKLVAGFNSALRK
jgi:hypothetical protein